MELLDTLITFGKQVLIRGTTEGKAATISPISAVIDLQLPVDTNGRLKCTYLFVCSLARMYARGMTENNAPLEGFK